MNDKDQTLEARCRALLAELGLARPGDIRAVLPLTGGVASDIAKVTLEDAVCCVKFALPKLKVAQDWRAPVHRNAAEYAWLQVAAHVAPDVAPRLFGRSDRLHGFAMEYLEGRDVHLWKAALLAGTPPRGEARLVADLLGRIHAHSAGAGFDRGAFRNSDDFEALRLEPYLRFTASRNGDLATPLHAMADRLRAADRVLVHGDVSPKNILVRGGQPVLLDAECATMGDACFDVAFCMNHLILKAGHMPALRGDLLDEALGFWRVYRGRVDWEEADALEGRVAGLLPMLMLARVDGKSPVEYLAPRTAAHVRRTARALIRQAPATVGDAIGRIATQFEDIAHDED